MICTREKVKCYHSDD